MFSLNPDITRVDAQASHVLCVMQSLNAVAVQVPGVPPSPAKAYMVAWEHPDGAASVLVYLDYPTSKHFAVYTPRPVAFDIGDLPTALAGAEAFLDSMGFMMDDLGFPQRTDEAQRELMGALPPFDLGAGRKAISEPRELPASRVHPLSDTAEAHRALAHLLLSL